MICGLCLSVEHMEKHDLFHNGISLVHENYTKYFNIHKDYASVVRISSRLLTVPRLACPTYYSMLYYIDKGAGQEGGTGVSVQWPHGHSIDTGLKL